VCVFAGRVVWWAVQPAWVNPQLDLQLHIAASMQLVRCFELVEATKATAEQQQAVATASAV
jgi:hypothetical protein